MQKLCHFFVSSTVKGSTREVLERTKTCPILCNCFVLNATKGIELLDNCRRRASASEDISESFSLSSCEIVGKLVRIWTLGYYEPFPLYWGPALHGSKMTHSGRWDWTYYFHYSFFFLPISVDFFNVLCLF